VAPLRSSAIADISPYYRFSPSNPDQSVWHFICVDVIDRKQYHQSHKGFVMNKPKARFVLLIVATLALAATAFAQPGDVDRHKRIQTLTMENFRSSLTSDIQGVVEWTILDVVVYKKYYPDLDYDRIVPRLNHLAETSKVPLVSYKAHLASMYLSYGEKIALEVPRALENEEDVFKQIAEQLEKNLLSANLSGSTASTR
jgi:hypothetical protein